MERGSVAHQSDLIVAKGPIFRCFIFVVYLEIKILFLKSTQHTVCFKFQNIRKKYLCKKG